MRINSTWVVLLAAGISVAASADDTCKNPQNAAVINGLASQEAAFKQEATVFSGQLETLYPAFANAPDLASYDLPDDPSGSTDGLIGQEWTDKEVATFDQQFTANSQSNSAYAALQTKIDGLTAQIQAIATTVAGEPTQDQKKQIYALYTPLAAALLAQLPLADSLDGTLIDQLESADIAAQSAPTGQALLRYAYAGARHTLALRLAGEAGGIGDNLSQMCAEPDTQ